MKSNRLSSVYLSGGPCYERKILRRQTEDTMLTVILILDQQRRAHERLRRVRSLVRKAAWQTHLRIKLEVRSPTSPAPPLILFCPNTDGLQWPNFKKSNARKRLGQLLENSAVRIGQSLQVRAQETSPGVHGVRRLFCRRKYLLAELGSRLCSPLIEVILVSGWSNIH
jgi:hypothetical protein